MNSHEIDYKIYGDDMQIVAVELDPGETVIAEAGAMNWLDPAITFESRMGDGSQPEKGIFGKLLDVGKRVLTGESIFITHFTNNGEGKKEVSFAAPFPGKIIPVDLKDYKNGLLCQKDSFLCAAKGTEVSIAFTKKLGTGFFGGEGFILQKLRGDGMAFMHAGGTVVKKELNNSSIYIDTGCIVAFTDTLDYSIERAGNLKSMFFGGEGMFLAKLTGTGTVFMQSLPFSRLADRILMNAPRAGGRSQGEGSVLGGLGRILDGDNF
ncbi:MAG TPA: TIGR00266 family protein [Lutibacter sp.]|nr:TIGR00266 family protein [Lutibacter sp.]